MATSNAWYWWVLSLVIVVGVIGFALLGGGEDDLLRKEGLAASGRVLAARQTGTWVNNNPKVELELLVSGGPAAEYEARLRAVIPQVNLPAVQPGAVLKIKVARDDPQRVVLDEAWAR